MRDYVDYDGLMNLSNAVGIDLNCYYAWRLDLEDNKNIDLMLKVLAETEELMTTKDALSKILAEDETNCLSGDESSMLSAAGTSDYQKFLERLNKSN